MATAKQSRRALYKAARKQIALLREYDDQPALKLIPMLVLLIAGLYEILEEQEEHVDVPTREKQKAEV
jgi:hypothetical protein